MAKLTQSSRRLDVSSSPTAPFLSLPPTKFLRIFILLLVSPIKLRARSLFILPSFHAPSSPSTMTMKSAQRDLLVARHNIKKQPSLQAAKQPHDDVVVASAITKPEEKSSLLSSIASLRTLPKLIVFDLDNTLWTPELYQIRQSNVPKAGKDIRLFDDATRILQFLRSNGDGLRLTSAIASRTSKGHWAQQLLDDFSIPHEEDDVDEMPIRSLFEHVVIETGSKKKHLARLREMAGVTYGEMLFVDDDVHMNLNECSQLGVCCLHTPNGITCEHFVKGLIKYDELKSGHDENHWMGYILNNDNLGIESKGPETVRQCVGRIKFYNEQKKFGFVKDDDTGDEFFFHESKVPAGTRVQKGDVVSFEAILQGRPSAVILEQKRGTSSSSFAASASSSPTASSTTTMPCFTMSQPFASLLLNGYKIVESRNNPMFVDVQPGTQVLIHCGRKDWHDRESYKRIMAEEYGLSDDEIENASRLPKGFSKGSILGVVTVGTTWKTTDQERKGMALQKTVLAPYEGIGKFCTEIVDAKWLRKAHRARGNPGIYEADVPKTYLPNER